MADLITGFHGIEEMISADREGVFYIAKKSPRAVELLGLIKKKGWAIKHVKPNFLDKRCGPKHRGFAFEVVSPEGGRDGGESAYPSVKQFLKSQKNREKGLVLILDGITDPHNLGAILRSADQFAVDLVIIPGRRSAGESDTVARASAGASQWVPLITVSNLTRALEELKDGGYWIYGADMGGTPARDLDFDGPTALVMGSEGSGMSRIVKEACDAIVSIPMGGHVDSLNVSVAAGILLYEARCSLGKRG